MTYDAGPRSPPGLSFAPPYAAALSPVFDANAARVGVGSRRIAAASAKEFWFAASAAPPPRAGPLFAEESHAGLPDAVSSGDFRRGIAVVASSSDVCDLNLCVSESWLTESWLTVRLTRASLIAGASEVASRAQGAHFAPGCLFFF